MIPNLRGLAPEPAAPRSDYAVQGLVPERVFQPTEREQATAVLAAAQSHGLAVVPWGGGTQQDGGYPPERLDIVLDLSHLRRIVEYEPDDLTITVEAGCTLTELQQVLTETHQTLPLDPPLPDQATIGGLLATNTNGPRRYGNGAWRDRLLGLRFLRADGTLIKSGGKVVKNTAGLDLGKLLIGSFGTLGVLIEATFKLHPAPATERLLRLTLPSSGAAEEVLAALMETPLLPSLIELRGGKGHPESGTLGTLDPLAHFRYFSDWALFLGFEGAEETVAWEIEELQRVLTGPPKAEVTEVPSGERAEVLRQLANFPAAIAPASGRMSLRVSLLGSAVAGFCQTALDRADHAGAEVAFQASAGNGVVHVHLAWNGTPASEIPLQVAQQLCEAAVAGGGNLMVTAAPPELKPHLPVWGAPRDDFILMQRVKQQMDPDRILNPGRFVGKL